MINILFVGHDITYVDFYNLLSRNLDPNSYNTKHIYLRPSALLYARFKYSIRSPNFFLLRFLKERCLHESIDNDIDYRFYKSSIKNNLEEYRTLFLKYYKKLDKELSDENFDFVIMPGEYRLLEQAIMKFLHSRGLARKIYFFEAGPPGYTYFDIQGVNANSSFREKKINKLTQGLPHNELLNQIAKPSKIIIFLKITDLFWLFMSKLMNCMLDGEEYWKAFTDRFKKSFKNKPYEKKQISPDNRNILFLDQLKRDVNFTHFGISDQDLFKKLSEIMVNDQSINMIWKNHPLGDKSKVLQRLKQRFNNRIIIGDSYNLDALHLMYQGCITVNSNGGIESLLAGKPVLTLGTSYYDNLLGVSKDIESFMESLNANNSMIVKSYIDEAKNFLRDCFVKIDYRNNKFSTDKDIKELVRRLF